MTSQLTTYITLFCTSGILNLYLCIYVYLKRHQYTNIKNSFSLYCLSITIYCFAAAFGLTASNLQEIKLWTIVQYIGMPFSSPLGLLFIMQYLGVKVTKKRVILLLSIPFISLIMVATNDFHHLHYKELVVDPALGAPYSVIEIGIWYLVHGMHTFGCMLAAFLLLILRWKETAKMYRPQIIALMFGQLVPMVTAFLYLIGATPPGFDPVPMVLWLTSILYLWAISSSRLFTVMPIAKNAIFHSISDGVIVLDEENHLIEYNEASKRMFPRLNKTLLGKDFYTIWQDIDEDLEEFSLDKVDTSQEMKFEIEASGKIYQIRTSPLQHGDEKKGLLIILTEITELKRLQSQLEQQAYFDELTQVYNRRAFFQHCGQKLIDAKENQTPLTIILFDIDYFKKVNDTYGHLIGDHLLKHVAKVCHKQIHKNALFARYGGEEFVIAIEGDAATKGVAVANEIRMKIASEPLAVDDLVISITASFGVAQSSGDLDETLTQVLSNADLALYEAKEEGRNRVHVYSEGKQFTS
ncbi:histidine kinase N-terminal 7TM domain-containing diguanylate cyclase [Ureibacillus aquaedulcis]|uniref:Diguanylate cyclase n=1 Tax=Ureibacillus aquaedulcis TaxID=3058421 RepID=A0ABT8GTM5_9BACL|nr:histidine kinase N-terminal 7TM domain-containing protein [Ureibacillus sp. BA0131]MDN4494765.1 diguanylate cyclase [Ureibacillus sp. BA0131]